VAGIVWSAYPKCTNDEIRAALVMSAKDLGAPGPDNWHGYGLVQAKAALDYLAANTCQAYQAPGKPSKKPVWAPRKKAFPLPKRA
jgi:hypothetical protein